MGWSSPLERLGGSTRLVPVGPDVDANRAWLDRDIASLTEGMFGEMLDPRVIDEGTRSRVAARLPRGWRLARVQPEHGWSRWWVEEDGAAAGTMALLPPLDGRGFLHVASVYTDPGARRRGVAARALGLAEVAAVRSRFWGIALNTEWTWFHPARLYLKLGFWVRHWKDALTLQRGRHLPGHIIEILCEVATFSVVRDGHAVPLLRARRSGERLGWEETPALGNEDEALYAAAPTFALALALAGWPLYRSDEAWERSETELDVGGPEALSRRIELWEALARRDGLVVRSPRVPGVAYREVEEILGSGGA